MTERLVAAALRRDGVVHSNGFKSHSKSATTSATRTP